MGCEVCRQGNREHLLLLCDSCDLGRKQSDWMKVKYLIFFLEKLAQFIPFFAFLIFLPSSLKNGIIIIDQTWGYHTTCLTPALEEVPRGAWYCPTCAGVGVGTSGPTMDIAVEENRPFPPIQRPRRYTIPRYLFWVFRVWSFWECNVFWVFPVLRVCEWTSVSRCWDLILFKFLWVEKKKRRRKKFVRFYPLVIRFRRERVAPPRRGGNVIARTGQLERIRRAVDDARVQLERRIGRIEDI